MIKHLKGKLLILLTAFTLACSTIKSLAQEVRDPNEPPKRIIWIYWVEKSLSFWRGLKKRKNL